MIRVTEAGGASETWINPTKIIKCFRGPDATVLWLDAPAQMKENAVYMDVDQSPEEISDAVREFWASTSGTK